MIDRMQLQQLTSLPIESVASRLGLAVSHHRCLCPFHTDKHPSLTFDTRRNRYRCFVCGEFGRSIDLVMKTQSLSFPDACRWLAEGTNVILREEGLRGLRGYEGSKGLRGSKGLKGLKGLNGSRGSNGFEPSRYERFFEHPFLSPEAQSFLFGQRRLDPRVVRWCRITSWQDRQGTHWLQTPFFDQEGRLIGIQNRNLDYRKGSDDVRFRFPQGSRCSIYNLPVVKMLRPGEELWITEGCSDCWSMLSAGHKAIAIPSATLLKPDDLGPLRGLNLQMAPDQDEPGERLFLQLRDQLPQIVRHQLPSGCKDYSEYYLSMRNGGKSKE